MPLPVACQLSMATLLASRLPPATACALTVAPVPAASSMPGLMVPPAWHAASCTRCMPLSRLLDRSTIVLGVVAAMLYLLLLKHRPVHDHLFFLVIGAAAEVAAVT